MELFNSDERILSVSDRKTQSQFLSDVSLQDKPWDSHKAFNDKIANTLNGSDKVSHQKQGKRINECSQNLEFGWVLVSTETGELKLRLKHAWFCRVRYCPICQWRRALMWVSRFFDAFPRIYAAHPEMRYIMLTLTVRNCSISELRATVDQMAKSWERLTKRKDFPALGFVRSLEVTRGDNGSCHPHFHILLAVPPSYFGHSYLSKDKWAALWLQSLHLEKSKTAWACDWFSLISEQEGILNALNPNRKKYQKNKYMPVCDVRIVKEKAKKEKLVEGLPLIETESTKPEPMKGLMSAITETIKYSTKPADMVKEKAWLLEMVDQMRNVRAVSLGGIFKQFLKETETEQDLITPSEQDIAEAKTNEGGFMFGWRSKLKRYVYTGKKQKEESEKSEFTISFYWGGHFKFKKPLQKMILNFYVLPVSKQKRMLDISYSRFPEFVDVFPKFSANSASKTSDNLDDDFSFGNAPDYYGEYD
jgi:plasmid rolling circle replication initiator protein Rep